jgi:ParB-like chromosome segregation protein Spo0J
MKNLIFVPLAKIKLDPNQPRLKAMRQIGVESISEDMKKVNGQLVPTLVAPPIKGIYPLLDGERRYWAAERANAKVLLCLVCEDAIKPIRCKQIQFASNFKRRAISPGEASVVLGDYMDIYSREVKLKRKTKEFYTAFLQEMCRSTGMCPSYWRAVITLAEFPEHIESKVNAEDKKQAHADAIILQKAAKNGAIPGNLLVELDRATKDPTVKAAAIHTSAKAVNGGAHFPTLMSRAFEPKFEHFAAQHQEHLKNKQNGMSKSRLIEAVDQMIEEQCSLTNKGHKIKLDGTPKPAPKRNKVELAVEATGRHDNYLAIIREWYDTVYNWSAEDMALGEQQNISAKLQQLQELWRVKYETKVPKSKKESLDDAASELAS